jgi:hypothetical protein
LKTAFLLWPARLVYLILRVAGLKARATKAKEEATAFAKLMAVRNKELKAKRAKAHERRRISSSKDTTVATA